MRVDATRALLTNGWWDFVLEVKHLKYKNETDNYRKEMDQYATDMRTQGP